VCTYAVFDTYDMYVYVIGNRYTYISHSWCIIGYYVPILNTPKVSNYAH